MYYYTPDAEPISERILLIHLEPRPGYGGDHRHIRASFIRRAVPHSLNEDGSVKHYQDDKAATGFRNATWIAKGKTPLRIADLIVRGQIDAYGPNKLAEGKPYANKLKYDVHQPEWGDVRQMYRTMEYLEKRRTKLVETDGHIFRDYFHDECRFLCLAAGVKRCAIYRNEHVRDLHRDDNLITFHMHDLEFYVNKVLARIPEGF